MSIDTSSRVITRTIKALKLGISYILHQGGTSSGKTFGILYSILFYALSEMRAGSVISIVSQTLPHLKKGAIADFKKILSMTGMEGKVSENKSDHVFTLHNGTRIEFYSPDDAEKAKSGKRDLLFINEANSVLYSIAIQLMMRTSGPVILDWNPSGKFWLHRMLLDTLESHEYVFTRTTYRDNKGVSDKIIKELDRLKLIDYSLYEIYALGIEGKGSEIIFPKYEIVDKFPDTPNVGTGLDFGFTNHPSASVDIAMYNGCLYFNELFYEKGMSNRRIYERYEALNHTGDVVADSAEPKSISELQDYGLSVKPAVKGPDSIKFGIDKIKEYPMYITKSSLNFLDEVDSYKWEMKDGMPTQKPKGGHDHLMDAARYGIQLIIDPSEPMTFRVQNARNMGFTNVWI